MDGIKSEPQHLGAWLKETALRLAANGWQVLPCVEDEAGIHPAIKYKGGQRYELNAMPWKVSHRKNDAGEWVARPILRNVLAVRLDDAVLVDYDGNKRPENPAIPTLAELENLLRASLAEPNQWRESEADDARSLHWLFKLPEDVNPDTLKYSQDGQLAPGLDIKRGHQIVFIKYEKTLKGGTLPPVSELPVAPAAIVEALKEPVVTLPDGNVVTRSEYLAQHVTYQPSDFTDAYGMAALNNGYRDLMNEHSAGRNVSLHKYAFRLFQLVAGGHVADFDAESAVSMAGMNLGLPDGEVENVIKNARAGGAKYPRNKNAGAFE